MKALLVSAAALGLLSAAPAFAQAGPVSPSASAQAEAIVVAPISVTLVEGTKLNFGKIAAPATGQPGGTITVNAAGVASSSTPNLLVNPNESDAADFAVKGGAGLAYTTALSSGTISLTGSNGGTMTVTLNKVGGSGNLDSNGDASFTVAGSVAVSANQTPGSYTGSFSVTAQYN